MIRQPLEDGTNTVARAKRTITYPAQFICVASLNPCPCGYYSSKAKRCRCTPNQIERYLSKVSGPLLDRMDIHIDVRAASFGKLRARQRDGMRSRAIRADVLKARDIQFKRFGGNGLGLNATKSHRQVEQCCQLNEPGEMLLKNAMTEFGRSARAKTRYARSLELWQIWPVLKPSCRPT